MDTILIILSLLPIAICIPLTVEILSKGYVWTAAGVFGIMIIVEACLIFTSVTQSRKIQYDTSYDTEGHMIISSDENELQ